MKVGVAGQGAFGVKHIEAIKNISGVDVITLTGGNQAATEEVAKKFGIPVVPHVGDMGQVHQHLVLFNHIAIGHPETFLEYIPHLSSHFVHPVDLRDGCYRTPQEAGSSTDLL